MVFSGIGYASHMAGYRIGHGYDLHRLEPCAPDGEGRPFILGGLLFDHTLGPVGHSDGDAVLHAVTDAILGAIGEPDIGQLFPDTDPAHDGQDSSTFLHDAVARITRQGFCIGNIDITIICERPKIGPRKAEMRTNVASLLGCDESAVNLKGKTHEGVDAVGEGRAIEVHVVVLLASCGSAAKDEAC
jgi:2-C-methyl-D-erythritol 2,4-cyclodiphosphate synthase